MGRRRLKRNVIPSKKQSPAVQRAKSITQKYKAKQTSSPTTPRHHRVRRALYDVKTKKVSIRKAAEMHDLSYGFLYRRLSGEVDINKKNGPLPFFNQREEEQMALWLKEMASRGMGLKPCEFLDFVQGIVIKENRVTPFKDKRPGYDWYHSFLKRNSHIVQPRKETPLEFSRAKLSKHRTDKWYNDFKDFLISKGMIDFPERIWNADETGFSMGSKTSTVIGPTRGGSTSSQVPHVSGGPSKQRFTVMFCGCADGRMMPPFFVYPAPKPRGYNPLTGAPEGSSIAYTQKGWMDATAFRAFVQHFDQHCGRERPVVLLIDSVSSHVDFQAFQDAKERGIELYRIVPNATHVMQPLDKGVFGPLKARWNQVVRKHSREHPGMPIGKETFAEKLQEAFLLFYKPLTVINSFRSSGIFPVDSSVITLDHVKPGLTFTACEDHEVPSSNATTVTQTPSVSDENTGAAMALRCLEDALSTPTREKYQKRIQERYDVVGLSPCFDTYKKLHDKSCIKTTSVRDATSTTADMSGLELLASAATSFDMTGDDEAYSVDGDTLSVSPILQESLVLPQIKHVSLRKRTHVLDNMPDNVTSDECIRAMSLKSLQKVRQFAEREKRARVKFMLQGAVPAEGKSVAKKKASVRVEAMATPAGTEAEEEDVICMGCHMSWREDQELECGHVWVECDSCKGWIHSHCSTQPNVSDDDQFMCPSCENRTTH